MKNKNIEYIEEIKEVARTCILPNGDHILVTTQLWLEDLIERIDEPYFGWCGGTAWRKTGYWTECRIYA